MSVYNYLAPRYPECKEPTSVEECLTAARGLVQKLTEDEKRPPAGAFPRFYTREGSTFLIVTFARQNKYIVEAIAQALKEQGAGKVDCVTWRDVGVEEPKLAPYDFTQEAEALMNDYPAEETSPFCKVAEATGKYLDDHPEYSFVCLGSMDRFIYPKLGKHGHKFNSFWPYYTWERFLGESHYLPFEVWREVDRRIVGAVENASEVRFTDPQGTHMEWSVTAEQAKEWATRPHNPGELEMGPSMNIWRGRPGLRLAPSPASPFTGATGVLAATASPHGFFPHMECHFENDCVVEVKGGGKLGDMIREMLDRWRDVELPGYPGKGFFWAGHWPVETTIGQLRPKSTNFRAGKWQDGNGDEHLRMGVFHCTIGCQPPPARADEFREYCEKHNVPAGAGLHAAHLYFATLEIKIRGTDYWQKIVDKGWVTALDDPIIRKMAAKYGDPDEMFQYDWIPPLPGINCEGDYLKDYAPDPLVYLQKRLEEGKTI